MVILNNSWNILQPRAEKTAIFITFNVNNILLQNVNTCRYKKLQVIKDFHNKSNHSNTAAKTINT